MCSRTIQYERRKRDKTFYRNGNRFRIQEKVTTNKDLSAINGLVSINESKILTKGYL